MGTIYELQPTTCVRPWCSFSFNDAVNNHSFVIYSDLTYECSPGFDATIGGKIFAQSIMVGSEYLAGIKESSLEREANFYLFYLEKKTP